MCIFITTSEVKLKFTIDTINGIDGFNETSYDIDVGGKNLIITGNNGAGKTRFLGKIYDKIDDVISSYDIPTIENLTKTLKDNEQALLTTSPGQGGYDQFKFTISEVQKRISDLKSFNIEFNDAYAFKSSVRNRQAFVYFFPAMRAANIHNDGRITSRETLLSEYNQSVIDARFDAGQFLERSIIEYLAQ